ncbi:5-hydroxytryptamine receptor 3A [Nematolebias whitei]|uniref:5-hydroxytryptamine receptor 3A n=1 Tax=Nematolebias whitei TaxID=451745 RepID=UPI00189B347E|nr:5-hydroxytryptamine receptor 3A [Nematolebias whitei]
MAALMTLTFLAVITGVSTSQTSDCSYNSLLDHLNLTSSNTLLEIMRPVKNWTRTTIVQMDMLVYSILGVDEKFQTVTCHIQINTYWTNEFLSWNASEFCGIDMLTLPRSMLWIPYIAIAEDTSDTGSIQEDPLVSLYPSGLVFANSRYHLTYTCQLNLFTFPFDQQRCNITFSSPSSGGKFSLLFGFRE